MFEVDPLWPKPLPNHWLLGSAIGVGVDSRDHVFVIHRRQSFNTRTEIGAAMDPPTGECCVPAPNILEFDPQGNLINSWGGPSEEYQWPSSNHGLSVDPKDNIWIGGNGRGDSHILKFTRDGKFLAQFGKPGMDADSSTTAHFGRVAKISFDATGAEAFVSDGYSNKRVAVLDAETGAVKRFWGAYGNEPDDADLGPYDPDAPLVTQFRNPVHCAEPANDGLVYVCDRANDRIQVFKADGSYVTEKRIAPRTLGDGSTWDIRQEHEGVRDRKKIPGGAHQLRRRWSAARSVLCRAQHRHRFEGQHLHHGDLRRKARAEVRLQGHGSDQGGRSGRGLAGGLGLSIVV
jgi:hypothetical protein